jgi:hypothetical protein
MLKRALRATGRTIRVAGTHGVPLPQRMTPATGVIADASGGTADVIDPLAAGRRTELRRAKDPSATTFLRLSNGGNLRFTARSRVHVIAWLSGDIVRAPHSVDLTLPGAPRPDSAPGPNQLTFKGDRPFRVGQTLVIGSTKVTPSGLIAQVTEVDTTKSATTVTYTQGGLLDAFKKLTLVSQIPAPTNHAKRGAKARPSDATPVNTTYGPTFSGSTGNVSLAPSVTANVSYSFHPYVTIVITITTNLKVIPTGVKVYYALDAATSLDMSVTAGQSWSGSHTFSLGHKILDAFDIGPVVVTPELAASLTVGGNAAAQITLDRSITEDAHVGMTLGASVGHSPYIVGDGNNGFHKPVVDGNSAPNLNVSASADAKLSLQFSLDIYGEVGPDAAVTSEVHAGVNPTANPWWEVDASGDLSIGIDLNALNIGLLTKALNLLHIPTNPSWTLGHLGPYTLLSANGPFTGTAGGTGVTGTGSIGTASGPGTGTQPVAYGGATGTPSTGATVELTQGPIAPDGYRYAVTLYGFTPNSTVGVECYDSASPTGFYSFNLTTNASGYASISSGSCYSGDGPDHWVVAGGVGSNHVTWGASAPAGPTPTAPTQQPPPPAANPTIQIGWSAAHPSWITMTMSGFSPGSYTYSCDFGSGGDESFTVGETSEPETFDNGHTCYDTIPGDTVWVTVNGVRSNTISVGGSSSSPPPSTPTSQTWSETVGGVSHTWTNPANAGGTEGPSIAAYQTVQIGCRLQGFTVADGNNWWYRIASSPWNNGYYVSADAFYNNGSTSGSLHGTPFVDPNVATC